MVAPENPAQAIDRATASPRGVECIKCRIACPNRIATVARPIARRPGAPRSFHCLPASKAGETTPIPFHILRIGSSGPEFEFPVRNTGVPSTSSRHGRSTPKSSSTAQKLPLHQGRLLVPYIVTVPIHHGLKDCLVWIARLASVIGSGSTIRMQLGRLVVFQLRPRFQRS